MPLERGRQLGAYEVEGLLGAGGMGEVYRARDTRLGRPVAIKFVSDELSTDPKASERLAREARVTSALNHPNIVTVYDVGEADGRPFIVMEFVAGQSLHERLAAGALPLRTTVDIACQIAEGLAAAHGAGVVHRDLKPRNIMLTEEGRAKIVDFGLGKPSVMPAGADDPTVRAPSLTGGYSVVGTAGYMAPEQVTGRPVSIGADQFSLGAVIYEMATGRRAFKRGSPVQTMADIVDAEPHPLSELCPAAPPELVTVVQRCLAKEPANRYASTLDLSRDLQDVKALLNTGSRSGFSARPVVMRPSSRRRLATSLAALAVLAAAGAVGWFTLHGPGAPTGPSPLEEGRALLVRFDKRANVTRAVELLSGFVAAHPNDPAAIVTLAEAYFRQWEHGRTDQSLLQLATDHSRTAQNLNDASSDLHVVWAMINFANRRFDGAATEAERAIALDANNSRAWQERGLALQALGQSEEAEKALLKAVSMAGSDWRPHHFLGRFYLQTGQLLKGTTAYQQAYALAPDNIRVLNNLGTALFLTENLEKASGIYQQSLTVEPSATAFSNYGTVLYEQGHYEDAAIQFESAVLFAGATSVHWKNLADACHWVPRLKARARVAHETAAKLGEEELKVSPTPELKSRLADTYAALGQVPKARRFMDELGRQGRDASTLYALATLYERFGERTKALETLARAVKAGYSVARVERSPWLKDLREDKRYPGRQSGRQ